MPGSFMIGLTIWMLLPIPSSRGFVSRMYVYFANDCEKRERCAISIPITIMYFPPIKEETNPVAIFVSGRNKSIFLADTFFF